MATAIPGNYNQTASAEDDSYMIEELYHFGQRWLANGARELLDAHSSAIAGHLYTLTLYRTGTIELFDAIEHELLTNNRQKLNEFDLVYLKWTLSAFSQRGLGSATFYQAIGDRLLENDGAFLRQYTRQWISEVASSFAGIPIDTTKLYEMINQARAEAID